MTPTAKLLHDLEHSKNAVNRSVLRQIISNRIDQSLKQGERHGKKKQKS